MSSPAEQAIDQYLKEGKIPPQFLSKQKKPKDKKDGDKDNDE